MAPRGKKTEIEQAAIKLFAERGVSRTAIKDIALEAGVTEGALYRHYAGKNEMAVELAQREMAFFAGKLSSLLLKGKGNCAERLEAGIRFMYSFYTEHPDRFAVAVFTRLAFPQESYPDESTTIRNVTMEFLAGCMEQGEIAKGDPVMVAAFVQGVIMQPIIWHRQGRMVLDRDTLERVIDSCHRLLGL